MNEQPTDQVPAVESAVESPCGMVGLTPLAQQYLDQTRPWARFVSIMTFVTAGFMVLTGFGMLVFSLFGGFAERSKGELGPFGSAIGAGLLSLAYVVMAVVYVPPGLYLFRYASAIKRLKSSANAAVLEDALKHQKSFWRYVGILMAVCLAVAVVGMILVVVAVVIAAVMASRS
jgi:disulfide bond formation protein DsbB